MSPRVHKTRRTRRQGGTHKASFNVKSPAVELWTSRTATEASVGEEEKNEREVQRRRLPKERRELQEQRRTIDDVGVRDLSHVEERKEGLVGTSQVHHLESHSGVLDSLESV